MSTAWVCETAISTERKSLRYAYIAIYIFLILSTTIWNVHVFFTKSIHIYLLRSSISFKSFGVSLSEWICSRKTSVHECKDSIIVHGLEISTTCTITVFVTLLGVSAYCRRLLWRGSPSNIQTPSRVVSKGSRNKLIVRYVKKRRREETKVKAWY